MATNSRGKRAETNASQRWSKTTLKHMMMVERYPNLKEEVGGSIPGCEISFLLDKKLVRWSIASCAMTLACRPSVSKRMHHEDLKNYISNMGDLYL